jgi:uncharacterized RDD family membrane protein YckC
LAKLVDTVIVLIPGLIFTMLIAWDQIQDQIDDGDSTFSVTLGGGRGLAAEALWGLTGLLYYAILNGRGQTLGKMAFGIRVVRADNGSPTGIGKGFARHVIQFVTFFVFCLYAPFILIDGLWPLWDKQRQALHDKVAGTLVVRAR